MLEQIAADLAGRAVKPALAGAEEAALVGKSQQVGGLGEGEVQPAEILLGQLAPRGVQQLPERGRLRLQPPLKRALAHVELAGDPVAPRLAVRQATNDHLARAIARLRVIEASQIVAGIALMQFGELHERYA